MMALLRPSLLLAIALALSVAAVGVLYYQSRTLRAELATAEQARAALQVAADEALAERERTDALLAQRERERDRLAREASTLRRRLANALDSDEARDWAARPLPVAIAAELRVAAGGGGGPAMPEPAGRPD